MTVSYKDIIENGDGEPQRTPEDVIESIKKKLKE